MFAIQLLIDTAPIPSPVLALMNFDALAGREMKKAKPMHPDLVHHQKCRLLIAGCTDGTFSVCLLGLSWMFLAHRRLWISSLAPVCTFTYTSAYLEAQSFSSCSNEHSHEAKLLI